MMALIRAEWRGIFLGIVIGVPTGVLTGVLTNVANLWLGQPTWTTRLERALTLTTDEFLALPPRWRQIVSDIVVAPHTYQKDVVRLVGRLTTEDFRLLETLSKYVVERWILRDPSHRTRHPTPDLSVADFVQLERQGILSNAEMGLRVEVTPEHRRGTPDLGQGYYLRAGPLVISASHRDSERSISLLVTPLTSAGAILTRLRSAYPPLGYLEKLLERLDGQGFTVAVSANLRPWRPRSDEMETIGPFMGFAPQLEHRGGLSMLRDHVCPDEVYDPDSGE